MSSLIHYSHPMIGFESRYTWYLTFGSHSDISFLGICGWKGFLTARYFSIVQMKLSQIVAY